MKMQALILVLGMAATSAMAGEGKLNFNDADTNADGAITREEAASFAALEAVFDSADANSNGLIEMQEFSAVDVPAEAAEAPAE